MTLHEAVNLNQWSIYNHGKGIMLWTDIACLKQIKAWDRFSEDHVVLYILCNSLKHDYFMNKLLQSTHISPTEDCESVYFSFVFLALF